MEKDDERWELNGEDREAEEEGGAQKKEMMKMKVMRESEYGAVGAPLVISLDISGSLSNVRLEREIKRKIRQ